MRLIKLVRDRIDEYVGDKHHNVMYQTLTKEAHVTELRKKLLEECAEYLLEPSLGELADIYEVLRALADVDLDISFSLVKIVADEKRAQRGGFIHGLGMYCA
jgi:predicted house-cleaning noncanonical NTP pyrophosphatase (MazG superfamily)